MTRDGGAAAKLNSGIIHFIVNTFVFPTMTSQNVFCDYVLIDVSLLSGSVE